MNRGGRVLRTVGGGTTVISLAEARLLPAHTKEALAQAERTVVSEGDGTVGPVVGANERPTVRRQEVRRRLDMVGPAHLTRKRELKPATQDPRGRQSWRRRCDAVDGGPDAGNGRGPIRGSAAHVEEQFARRAGWRIGDAVDDQQHRLDELRLEKVMHPVRVDRPQT